MFAPNYNSFGNIKYEQIFIDVDSMDDGVQKIPFNFDTIFIGILYEDNNVSVISNTQCTAGTFFAPFVLCPDKETLVNRIKNLICELSKEMKQVYPEIKVYVYRYIDKDQKRFFAIAGTNRKAKHEKIHELKIKTLSCDPVKPSIDESWQTLVEELEAEPSVTPSCEIHKEDVFDFQSRICYLDSINKDALMLLPKNEEFKCKHIANDFKDKVIKLKITRMYSEDELNQSIKFLVETYRWLTGSTKVVAKAYYNCSQNFIDASVICFSGILSKEENDTESFL